MPDDKSIGLAELIKKVKEELRKDDGTEAMFLVGDVVLELQVIVKNEGSAGLNIHVIEFGADISKEVVQNIKVTLKPKTDFYKH